MGRARIRIFLAIILALIFTDFASAMDNPPSMASTGIPYYAPRLLDSVEDAAGKLQFLLPRIRSNGTAAERLTVDRNGVNIFFSQHGVHQSTQYFWSWYGGYNAPVSTPYDDEWSISISYTSVRGFSILWSQDEMVVSTPDVFKLLQTSDVGDMHMLLDALVTLTVASGNSQFYVTDFTWEGGLKKVMKQFKLDQAVMLTNIEVGGPENQAGMMEGDIILGINGGNLGGSSGMDIFKASRNALDDSPDGHKVHLRLLRNREVLEKDVTYPPLWSTEAVKALQVRTTSVAKAGGAQASSQGDPSLATGTPAAPGGAKLGVRAHNISPDEAKTGGLADVHGVLVDEVVAGGVAESAKVQVGDVIVEIDGAAVGSLDEIKAILLKGTPSSIKVWRKGAVLSLAVAQTL
jgi:PDZ domain